MTLYWVSDLPTWLFGTLTVVVFVAFGLAGLYLLRGWVQRLDNGHHVYNHIVGFFLAGVTVLYAVTAGRLAIGAWATFDQVQGKIDHEASALGGLYRDTIAYPEPMRTAMQEDLRRQAGCSRGRSIFSGEIAAIHSHCFCACSIAGDVA